MPAALLPAGHFVSKILPRLRAGADLQEETDPKDLLYILSLHEGA